VAVGRAEPPLPDLPRQGRRSGRHHAVTEACRRQPREGPGISGPLLLSDVVSREAGRGEGGTIVRKRNQRLRVSGLVAGLALASLFVAAVPVAAQTAPRYLDDGARQNTRGGWDLRTAAPARRTPASPPHRVHGHPLPGLRRRRLHGRRGQTTLATTLLLSRPRPHLRRRLRRRSTSVDHPLASTGSGARPTPSAS